MSTLERLAEVVTDLLREDPRRVMGSRPAPRPVRRHRRRSSQVPAPRLPLCFAELIPLHGKEGTAAKPYRIASRTEIGLQYLTEQGAAREEQVVGQHNISFSREKLAELCRRNRIRRLSFYGSVLRDDFGPESDVDVLVEFEPDHVVGLRIIEIQDELSSLLGGRKVDIANPKYLNPRLRDRILASAETVYATG